MSAGVDVVRRKHRGTGGRPGLPPKADRNAAMVAMRREGAAYREIAECFGVSHNRVWQIVSRELWRAAAQHHPSFAGTVFFDDGAADGQA